MSASSTSSTAPVPLTSSSSDSLALASPTATQQPSNTSSFSDFFTNAAASQTSSSSSDGDPSTVSGSTSLYLFTFLATLLLLLAISCGIIIRSFIIRRRFQRRVQEALAEGVVLTQPIDGPGRYGGFGPAGGRRRVDFGEKPKLWDAHLAPPVPPSKSTQWDDFMPVSAKIISSKLTGAGQQRKSPTPRPRSTFLQAASFGLVNRDRSWRRLFSRSGSPPSAEVPAPSAPSSTPLHQGSSDPNANAEASTSAHSGPTQQQQPPSDPVRIIEDARLQVSVLIAMPSPYRPRAWLSSSYPLFAPSLTDDQHASGGPGGVKGKTRSLLSESGNTNTDSYGDEDEELPDVALGTTEVPWKVSVPAPNPPSATPSSDLSEPNEPDEPLPGQVPDTTTARHTGSHR